MTRPRPRHAIEQARGRFGPSLRPQREPEQQPRVGIVFVQGEQPPADRLGRRVAPIVQRAQRGAQPVQPFLGHTLLSRSADRGRSFRRSA